MAFYESRINDTVLSFRLRGGPRFQTEVAEVRSGFEVRNINQADARRHYDLVDQNLTQAQNDFAQAWFEVMQGRAHGFRVKDWADYAATITTGILGTGLGTGAPTHQCRKRYTAGAATRDRKIAKLTGTPTAYRNSIAVGAATFASATGICTLPTLSSATITAITRANPGVVTTSAAHGFTTGDLIYISGVVGMTQVNEIVFTIGAAAGSTFNLGVNTTAYTAYSSGGTAGKYAQPADVLRWSGEFDVPVRFDTDDYTAEIITERGSGTLYALSSFPLIEIRT